jgi:hypothetical protein
MAVPSHVFSQVRRDKEIEFDIPAKPMAAALRDYGEASGLEVFYDGSLAFGQRSVGVSGRFTALDGLKELLRDTGYVARETEIPNTLTIVPGPSVDALRTSFARYQPYFADIQARVSVALCTDDLGAADKAIKFRLWLDPSGTISEARIFSPSVRIAAYERFEQRMRGVSIGKSPPHGLPQPVTMMVYPPSAGESTGCPDDHPLQTGR